jgi:3-hydroxyacyl-CoA dehydrogenase
MMARHPPSKLYEWWLVTRNKNDGNEPCRHEPSVRGNMDELSTYSSEGKVGIITINSPPVNALGAAVRRGLIRDLARANAAPAIEAIVLICAGRTFFAGADIAEFDQPMADPSLSEVMAALESSAKLVLAAIHGTALGGGLETALACHYRMAVPSARLGLPEVALGIMPGAGGTQRLPRLIGVERALDMILTGKPISAPEAVEFGLVDRLAREGGLLEGSLAYANELIAACAPRRKVRDQNDRIRLARDRPEIFSDRANSNQTLSVGLPAHLAILQAVKAAVDMPFEDGVAYETELVTGLMATTESKALRHIFFAEREASKILDVPAITPCREIGSVGVIGAGTMGGGIAMNFANVGIPVTLVDTTQAAVDRGLSTIRANYEASARKGRLSPEAVISRMALITPSVGLEPLRCADLIIEAAFEEMGVKKEIFQHLDKIAKPQAILASNTSFLDLDEIASATNRPESVIGLHFFSPANVMRLLEVVRGEKTSKELVATAMRTGKLIGKVPVLSRVCEGFIANRIMLKRGSQADALVLEGATPQEIDTALTRYGFAMGHFQMMDLVGLDVVRRNAVQRCVSSELVKLDRLGQKKNGGYYDYDASRRATPSPVAARVIADVAAAQGIAQRNDRDPAAILARLLYPVVNEGAMLLEEGIAARSSDIDVAAVLGYNWPAFTGGPMFWADTVGLPKIVDMLRTLEAEHGAAFTPSPLLVRLSEAGQGFARH